jgi:hypothetical protein
VIPDRIDVYVNFEALFLTAFNNSSYLVGGIGGAQADIDSTTFGQTTNMGAGPRAIVIRLQFGF